MFGVPAQRVLQSLSISKSKDVKSNDLRIFELASDVPNKIQNIDDKKFISMLSQRVKFWKDDLGIITETSEKQLYQYRMTRLSQYLKRHYKDFTFSEIKEAFELFIADKLSVLDHKGNKLQHFQSFDLTFISKILNTYRSERSKICIKLINLLPEEGMTEEEMAAKRAEFVDYFYEFYEDVKRAVNDPEFKIDRHRFYLGFQKLLIDNEVYNVTAQQQIKACRLAAKQLEKDLLKQRDNSYMSQPNLRRWIKELRIGHVPESKESSFLHLERKILLKIFLEDSAKQGIEFTNLK